MTKMTGADVPCGPQRAGRTNPSTGDDNQPARPLPSAEKDAPLGEWCCRCGAMIVQRYAGTFFKAPDPMPMVWVHVGTKDRACGYAEPCVTPPGSTPSTPAAYPAGHGWTPATGPFATGEACRVMLARYPCNYTRAEHDPDLPPVDVDVFGYRQS